MEVLFENLLKQYLPPAVDDGDENNDTEDEDEDNDQGLHRLDKYLNLEDFLEKSLKIEYALKSTGKSLKCLESP